MSSVIKLPTLQELITDSEDSLKQNALSVLLNQDPPEAWLSVHPTSRTKYLPINRVEYLLTRIFGQWTSEVKAVQIIANSVCVTIRLYVKNPITGDTMYQDGIGAAPIQTDKGAGAADWNAVKTDGVQKAAPAAESYAIKDAAEKFGKLFGADVGRKNTIDYNPLLKVNTISKSFEQMDFFEACTHFKKNRPTEDVTEQMRDKLLICLNNFTNPKELTSAFYDVELKGEFAKIVNDKIKQLNESI